MERNAAENDDEKEEKKAVKVKKANVSFDDDEYGLHRAHKVCINCSNYDDNW